MQIQIESRRLNDESGKSRIDVEQRVRFALRRLGTEVQRARISLRDINGPRGGVDKQCRLTLKTDAYGTLVVTAQAQSSGHALDRALQRATQALVRVWQRKRRPLRTPASEHALPAVLPA
jgi:hypothetical protein